MNGEKPQRRDDNRNAASGGRSVVRRCVAAVPMVAAVLLGGCGHPSAVNIELRKQNQDLQGKVDQLSTEDSRDRQALEACERSHPTTMSLSPARLAELFTTHGLKFGKLTGGDNPNPTANYDTQLKVFVVPVDQDGTPLKAAGTFKVEAYDLDDPAKPLVGTWNFDLAQTKGSFYSLFSLYTYVLVCPLHGKLKHPDLTLHVTFTDALTGGVFNDQVQAAVRLPAAP